jgi:hypothetical protein
MTTPTVPNNVPQAARKQIKEANRLQAEFANPNAAPAANAPPPSATPVVEAQPDPLKVVEHKYNVLAGKYNKETAELRGSAAALAAENARLQRMLVETAQQRAPASATPAPRAEEQFNLSGVTAKEREEYGEELVTLMAKIAKSNSGAEVARLTQELNAMKGQVQATVQVGQQTRMEKVWQALDSQVPTWRVLNDSQQFLDWLQNVDIMSGMPRQAGLTQAFESGDSHRVVGIFKRFIEEDSSARPTSQGDAPPAAQLNRETLIAPASGRGSGEGAPNGANKQVYTEQDIADFYSRVQRKRIDPEEAKAFEAELQLAVREGRVVPTRDDRHLANAR